MTKKAVLILLAVSALFAFTINNSKHISSKIKHVLVFFDAAQVTRTASVSLEKGITELYFDSLSTEVLENSIQLKNDQELTILGISFDTKTEKDKTLLAEITELEAKQRVIAQSNEYLNSQHKNLKDEYDFLNANRSIGGQQTGVSIQNLQATADFLRKRLQELLDKEESINQQSDKNNLAILDIARVLIKKKAALEHQFGIIRVKVRTDKAIKVNLELSYLVNKASWKPAYDLRLKDISHPLQLTYKAEVSQNTGIDWSNVKISLSNGTPTTSNEIPELLMWNMNYNKPIIRRDPVMQPPKKNNSFTLSGYVNSDQGLLPGVTILIKGTDKGTITDFDGKFALDVHAGDVLIASYIGFQQAEQTVYNNAMSFYLKNDDAQLDEVVVMGYGTRPRSTRAEKKTVLTGAVSAVPVPVMQRSSQFVAVETVQNQTTLQYDIETKYSIESGAEAFSVDIKQEDIPPQYQYATIPKLEKKAYLIARIPNWANYQLLDGQTNIYYEGTYMGQSRLSTDMLKDTMEVSIGRDESITISREKLKDINSRKLFGTKRLVELGYEISVRNNKKLPIEIVVQDHYPVSQQDEIEVTEIDHSGAQVDEKTRMLKWTIKVAPSTTEKRNLKFSVKYPKRNTIYLE